MLRGLTALVGLATTVCVGVFGVDAIRAVTAAAIMSLFFWPPPVSDLICLFVCCLLFVVTFCSGTCVWMIGGGLQLLQRSSGVQTVFNADKKCFVGFNVYFQMKNLNSTLETIIVKASSSNVPSGYGVERSWDHGVVSARGWRSWKYCWNQHLGSFPLSLQGGDVSVHCAPTYLEQYQGSWATQAPGGKKMIFKTVIVDLSNLYWLIISWS